MSSTFVMEPHDFPQSHPLPCIFKAATARSRSCEVDTTSLEAKQLQKRLQQMFAETPRLAVLLRKFVDEVKASVSLF